MTAAGIFISFEGIDGAGKSTHIAALAEALRQRGRTVTLTREPGGTPLAEKIRTLVLRDAMDPVAEALLMFAARRDHVVTVIVPALARGEVVLCDRFSDASFAYQGAARGVAWADLRALETMAQTLPTAKEGGDAAAPRQIRPDLTLWLDLEPRLAAARLPGDRDRFERLPEAFFAAARAGYARRCAEEPARFQRIDAGGAAEQVWAQIHRVVGERGWL